MESVSVFTAQVGVEINVPQICEKFISMLDIQKSIINI